jgi:hypothetical protein
MDVSALHHHLDEIAPAVLAGGEDAELAEAEAHAATGCSRCARALYNARETGIELSAEAEPKAPTASVRERLLASVRAKGLTPRGGGGKPRRFFDASGEVSRLHIGAPGDAERVAEIDLLQAAVPSEGDACERFLAQIERIIGFPLLFVSVVRGERVGYRVQRGLAAGMTEMRDRRRETTFCTHTVSSGEPLVAPNTGAEPFFRGSNMVTRVGVRAYVGVPLTTSRGITIGTVCAMDFRPRAVAPAVVRALELFTEPILAEVERARRMPAERVLRTTSGTPLHRAPWFRDLLAVELTLARAAGRPSALVVARGRDAEVLADAGREHEPAGRIAPDAVALLVPGADDRGGANRVAEIQDALASRREDVPVCLVPADGHIDAAAWIEAALRVA